MAAGAEVESGHADGDTVGDLLEDYAAGRVSDIAVDFNAAVDRPRMHDDGIRFDPAGTGIIEAKHAGIFANGGEVADALAFVLNAEQHDHVGIREGGAEMMRDFDAHGFEPAGDEGRGSDNRHISPEFGEGVNIRAGHSAKENIAEDDDLAAFQIAEFLAHREHIEQGLRWVFVRAVTGIDDGNI